MATRKYYVLLGKSQGLWQVEYGDFDRNKVKFQMDDYRLKGWSPNDLMFVPIKDDSPMSIYKVLNRLNGGNGYG